MIFEVPYSPWCILAIDKYNGRYAFRVFANPIQNTYNVQCIKYKTWKKLTKHLLMDDNLFKSVYRYFTTLLFNEEEPQDQETILERLIIEIKKRGFTILCKICMDKNEIIP